MASLVIKDVFGNVITGSTFSFPTTELGGSQFIQLSFNPAFVGAETATVPVSVIGGEGELVSSNSLVFDLASQSHLIEVRGKDDSVKDGSDDFTLRFDDQNSVSHDTDEFDLTILNSDNDGLTGNVAPTEPTLISPVEGVDFEAGSTGTVFKWEHAYDADEDELLYHVCFSQSASMTNVRCVTVTEANIIENSGVAGFGWVSSVLIATLILGAVVTRSRRFRRIRPVGVWILLISLGALGAACGNQSLLDALNLPARPKVSTIIPTTTPSLLNASGTWHWRVYADDQKGNITASSEVREIEAP